MAFRITLAVVVFSVLICKGCCINCFECNSANNSACNDISKYDEETLARIIPVVDCSRVGLMATPEQPHFFCRKLTQIIYNSDRTHSDDVRVTRSCGWITDKKDNCYQVHNADHWESSCQCFSDRCNSADSADPSSSVILFLTFSAVVYFYR